MNYKYTIRKRAPSSDLIGGKAWNLNKIRYHVKVPEFVVISTEAFRHYIEHKKPPEGLVQEIQQVFQELFRAQTIAVRSSGTAEDLSNRSYAGMYTTVLNVSGVTEIVAAITRVWDSNQSRQVKAYRVQHDLKPGDMAVILQQQLEPEVSGVMVTGESRRSEVIIECCRGLGDRLVSGEITPARYRMKGKKILERSGEDLLSRKALSELCATGQRIKRIFGVDQDIEWAYQKGKLYILQARPMTTTLQAVPKRGTVWCNANVRETIPDPISPMGYSFFEKIWIPDIMINTFGFPLTIEQYEKYPPVERVLGHLYWNISNTAAYGKSIEPILKFTGAGTAIDPQMGQAIESIDSDALPSLLSPTRMLLFSLSAMVRMPFFLIKSFILFRSAKGNIEQACIEVDKLAQDMHPVDDIDRGTYNVRYWGQIISGRLSKRYFSGILISVFYLALLSKILGWRMGKKGEAIARMTTYGLLDKTGEMVLAIRALALYVHRKISRVNNETLDILYEKDSCFRKQYDVFIAEYGHRGPGEFDIASLTWHEDKALVYGMIQNQPSIEENRRRSDIIKDILKMLAPFERYFTKLFIPRIEAFTTLRETAKHYIFKIMRKVKQQLHLLEDELIKRGYLEQPRDIYFLSIDDLEAIRGDVLAKENVLDMLHERKKEWQKYLGIEVPDIVYEDGKHVFFSTKEQDNLSGTPLSYGRVRGRAKIIHSFTDARILQPGDIMVTNHTDPGWTPFFSIVSGVIIEVGGLICHAAMVARELGLPTIVLAGAMSSIPDNAQIELDADEGTVRIIGQEKA